MIKPAGNSLTALGIYVSASTEFLNRLYQKTSCVLQNIPAQLPNSTFTAVLTTSDAGAGCNRAFAFVDPIFDMTGRGGGLIFLLLELTGSAVLLASCQPAHLRISSFHKSAALCACMALSVISVSSAIGVFKMLRISTRPSSYLI